MTRVYKTHAQEKAEREAERRSRAGTGRYPFEYRPGLMDRFDPTVLRGVAITAGAKVRIFRGGRGQEKVDPLGKIVYIEDSFGNEQSVWRTGLARVKS